MAINYTYSNDNTRHKITITYDNNSLNSSNEYRLAIYADQFIDENNNVEYNYIENQTLRYENGVFYCYCDLVIPELRPNLYFQIYQIQYDNNTGDESLTAVGQVTAPYKFQGLLINTVYDINFKIVIRKFNENKQFFLKDFSCFHKSGDPATKLYISYRDINDVIDDTGEVSADDNDSPIPTNYINFLGKKNNNDKYIDLTSIPTDIFPDESMDNIDLNHVYSLCFKFFNNSYNVYEISIERDLFSSTLQLVNSTEIDADTRIYGGIAIGCLTTVAEKKIPILECNYPSYFYNRCYFGEQNYKFGYYPGDEVILGKDMDLHGHITGSGHDLYLTINLGQPIFCDNIELTGKMIIRGVKGYIRQWKWNSNINNSGGKLSSHNVNICSLNKERGIITFLITRKNGSAFENIANNTPVAGHTANNPNEPLIIAFK